MLSAILQHQLQKQDIGYFNGYYGKTGTPMVVAYPGSETPVIAFNNGDPLWDEAGCKEGDTVTLTLHERGSYLDLQTALNTVYSDERSDYESDEQFCNFRAASGGSLAPNLVYRGASPVDNKHGRAQTTDHLLQQAGINFVLDLADAEDDLSKADLEAGARLSCQRRHDRRRGRRASHQAYDGRSINVFMAFGFNCEARLRPSWPCETQTISRARRQVPS